MSRTLPGSMGTAVQQRITSPIFLIDILLSSQWYFSSREEVTYQSNTYIANRVVIGSINRESFSFAAANEDRAISASALAGQIRENPVTLRLMYGADALILWSGAISHFETRDDDKGNWVDFFCESVGSRAAMFPHDRMRPENGFNHLPAAGTTIEWAGQIITLEPEPPRQ